MQLASRRMAQARQGVLAGHGAELSTSREDDDGAARQTSSTAAGRGSTTRPGGKRSATEGGLGCGGGDGMRRRDDARCGLGGCRGRAGVGDGGEIEDGGGGGEDRRVDRKVEDETVRYI